MRRSIRSCKVFDIATHMHMQRHGTAKRVGIHSAYNMEAKYTTFGRHIHVRHRDTSRVQTAYQAFLIRSSSFTDHADVLFMCGAHVTYEWCVEVATYAGTDPGSESYIQAVHTQMIRIEGRWYVMKAYATGTPRAFTWHFKLSHFDFTAYF